MMEEQKVEESYTLKEAFAKLINIRHWAKNAVNPAMAKKDKYEFNLGKNIPEERMRSYLSSYGAVKVQEEKWKL